MNLNFVDTIILTMILIMTVKGLIRGLVRSCFDILSFFLALYVSFVMYKDFAQILPKYIQLPQGIDLLGSFLILWIITYSIVSLIGFIIHKFIGKGILGPANIIGGGGLGILKGMLIVWLVLQFVHALPVSPQMKSALDESKYLEFVSPAYCAIPNIFSSVKEYIPAKEISDVSKNITSLRNNRVLLNKREEKK